MAQTQLGHIAVIVNPAAGSGRAQSYVDTIQTYLQEHAHLCDGFNILRTRLSRDAERIATAATNAQTVLAVGGDGIVHEVVNGLMALPEQQRPTLGIIPAGTGNDYARTLGIHLTSPKRALDQFFAASKRRVDVGCVNGRYFVESLSFGLDAAIALDTSARRSEDATKHGGILFVTSGLKLLSKASQGWHCRACFDGQDSEITGIMYAFQLGPTYGGGFRICPQANPTNGLLDTCCTIKNPSVPHALALFALSRFGWHTTSSLLAFEHIKHATLDFDEAPPAQTDGEELTGQHFEIELVPQALDVITGTPA